MPTVLPGQRDKCRMRGGKRVWIGVIHYFDGGKPVETIVEVRAKSLRLMRKRKHAIADVLAAMENDPPSKAKGRPA